MQVLVDHVHANIGFIALIADRSQLYPRLHEVVCPLEILHSNVVLGEELQSFDCLLRVLETLVVLTAL